MYRGSTFGSFLEGYLEELRRRRSSLEKAYEALHRCARRSYPGHLVLAETAALLRALEVRLRTYASMLMLVDPALWRFVVDEAPVGYSGSRYQEACSALKDAREDVHRVDECQCEEPPKSDTLETLSKLWRATRRTESELTRVAGYKLL